MSSNGFIYINNLFLIIIIIIIIIIIQLWWNSLFLQANWCLWNVGHRFTKNRFLILFPCSLTFVAFRIL